MPGSRSRCMLCSSAAPPGDYRLRIPISRLPSGLFAVVPGWYHALMRLSPCRFNVPLTNNEGQPIDPQVIVDLHHELLTQFDGFTIHPTSQGRWQSRAGRLYQEEVVGYEVAVP